MCGIAGILTTGAGVERASLVRMTAALAHRGPDGDGLWISPDGRMGLAHRRLTIIDLSEIANQPMANEDGTVQIVFNGEIYNHLRLRAALVQAGHTFRTDHSDTEVLIHGYEEWGIEGLLGRLEGMFAFALWDEARKTLTLARDRVGIKPIYFAKHEGAFRFASEIKGLLAGRGPARQGDGQEAGGRQTQERAEHSRLQNGAPAQPVAPPRVTTARQFVSARDDIHTRRPCQAKYFGGICGPRGASA